MRIKRLTLTDILPAIAHCVVTNKDKDKEKLGYVIRHGSFGPDSFALTTYLGYRYFKVGNKGDTLTLEGNEYICVPIIRKDENGVGTPIKDKAGNNIYVINKEERIGFNSDIIVYWEFPYSTYKDIEYSLEGKVRELAVGKTTTWYLDNKVVVPAPMLEVYGSCKLHWSGIDINKGQKISQIISYTAGDDIWSIPAYKIEELGEQNVNV